MIKVHRYRSNRKAPKKIVQKSTEIDKRDNNRYQSKSINLDPFDRNYKNPQNNRSKSTQIDQYDKIRNKNKSIEIDQKLNK